MKKLMFMVLCLLLFSSVMLSTVGCNTGNSEHTHSFTVQKVEQAYIASAATCTQPATYYYSCVCGEKDDKTFENGSALGHDIVKHVGKSAACTEAGYDAYETRTRCDYTTYKEIPAKQHEFVSGVCSRCGSLKPTDGLSYALNSDKKSYSCDGRGTATATDIVIADVYNGLPVTSIAQKAFGDLVSGDTNLKSVIIPNSVTEILDGAFSYCSGLTSVEIPTSVKIIDFFTFQDCTELKTVFYAGTEADWDSIEICISGNECIREEAKTVIILCVDSKGTQGLWYASNPNEAGCYSCIGGNVTDADITIANDYFGRPVTSIADYAFKEYTGIKSIFIGKNITSIGVDAFIDCTNLKNVTMLDGSVSKIGKGAFKNCSGLVDFTIPHGVTSIGDEAFRGCSGLKSITIPNSVTSIGHEAFAYCSRLDSIVVESGNTKYYSVNNCIIETESKTLLRGNGDSEVQLDYGIMSIGAYAFAGCSGITSIVIPDSVTSIGDFAFDGCSGLKTVYYEGGQEAWDSLKTGSNNECLTNAKIYVNDGTEGLVYTLNSDKKSYSCTGRGTADATDIVIARSYKGLPVTSIGENAFMRSYNITSVTIPASVKSIESHAFFRCNALKNVIVEDGSKLTTIGDSAFSITGLENIIIPDSVTSMGEYTFNYNEGLKSVVLSNGLKCIDYATFMRCSSLTSIVIGSDVTSIKAAFKYCENLKTIEFKGTKAEWSKIEKDYDWNEGIPTGCVIKCTDGDISLQ